MTISIRCGKWEDVLRNVTGVSLVFTSPPYNVGSKAKRRDGFRRFGRYDPKSFGGIMGYDDCLPQPVYEAEQVQFLSACEQMLADDGVVVYNHKPRRVNGSLIHPMQWIMQVTSLELMEEIIWDRGSTHNHSNRLFWPTTERLYVMKRRGGCYRFQNTPNLRFRSDVWKISLNNRPAIGHACPFSLELAMAVVEAYSRPQELVCDPYSGAGTTALAAQKLGRRFIGSEMNRSYYHQSLSRLKDAI